MHAYIPAKDSKINLHTHSIQRNGARNETPRLLSPVVFGGIDGDDHLRETLSVSDNGHNMEGNRINGGIVSLPLY